MYRRFFISFSAVVLLFSCNSGSKNENNVHPSGRNVVKKENHTLALLPFKGVDSILVHEIRTGLQKKLDVKISVLDVAGLPPFAFYKPRQRYIADSLLEFLRQTNHGKFDKIIGITTVDISTRKDPYENWGVLGLGSCPGKACVISSFRAGKNKVTYKHFIRRMVTLALHETGHTYGLEHCPDATCLMKDAEGKMNLDDGDSFCEKCRNYLSGKGLLK